MRGLTALVFLTAWAAAALQAQPGGYGGPSILSRGGNAPGSRGATQMSFQPYISLTGTFDNGVLPVSVDNQGRTLNLDLYGATVEIGGYGSKTWKDSTFGIEYRGDFRKYSRRGYFDGSDQAVDLVYTKQLNRALRYSVRQLAGTSTRAFGGYLVPGAYNTTDFIGVPTNEIFNNRFYYTQSTGTVSYRKSGRTFFSAAGDYYGVHRQSQSLISMTGYRASGQVEHYVNPRTVIGAGYDYLKFNYRRAFGGTDAHGVSILFERRLTRYWTVNAQIGGFRLESLGIERVTLDPAVAQILGVSTGTRVLYRVSYSPQINGTLNYRKRKTGVNFAYSRGVSPGNGVYLTSSATSYGAGISYAGTRKLSYGLNATRTTLHSVFRDTPGTFNSTYSSAGASYRMTTHMAVTGNAGYRQFDAGNLQNRNGFTASIGITYTPSDIPISLW